MRRTSSKETFFIKYSKGIYKENSDVDGRAYEIIHAQRHGGRERETCSLSLN
jgi:hypothetical protein